MHDKEAWGTRKKAGKDYRTYVCVTKEMKLPTLDEMEGQMKHVGKANAYDKGKKPCRQNWKDEQKKRDEGH